LLTESTASSPVPGPSRRYALGIEYDGTAFAGWQRQGSQRSVQRCLEQAVSAVADESVTLIAAGRTDAGVHANGQVAHFDSSAARSDRSWLLGINSNLPDDVVALWLQPVGGDFHARHSAVARTYRYLIVNRPVRPALERQRSWHIRAALDAAKMRSAAQHLLGEHDFSSFRGAGCQADSPVRRVDRLEIAQHGDYLLIDCRATGFLYHMVRNIVGSLAWVGRGDRPAEWLAELLRGRDRRLAAPTAPPQGLYLHAVHYPAPAAFPEPARFRF
jgi:tRNA pseudouridine38-40 synthase